MKTAIIDIGSNSVRLMLQADGKTLYKKLETTRLGAGLSHTGRLQEERIAASCSAIARFAEEGRSAGAEVYAFATAAVRSASNGGELVRRVREACGVWVDVVPGEEEALLGLYGALGNADGGILDVGGASTEVCLREGGEVTFARSLDVGAVRLYDLCGDSEEALERVLVEAVKPLAGVRPQGKFCAIGGTATTLASLKLGLREYDAARVQDLFVSTEEVGALAKKLLALSVEERKELAGMDARRADIIAGGAFLVWKVLLALGLTGMSVSDRDNLEGYAAMRGLV